MDLEIRHLKLVVAVAETGSVTAASKRLHVTQSALSHQLRDAEERVGTQLFLRASKRMMPTPACERLLRSARTILKELELTKRELGNGAGMIRLTTECHTCYHWLPPLLKEFRKKYPRVDISIDADTRNNPITALREGRLDVAMMSSHVAEQGLQVDDLFEDDLLLVMSAEHRLAKKKSVRPEDLAGETVLVYPPRSESTLLNRVLFPAGVTPAAVLEITLTDAILELACAGLGVALLARWAAASWLKEGCVAARPLANGGYHRSWKAVTLAHSPRAPYLEEFISLLRRFPRPMAMATVA